MNFLAHLFLSCGEEGLLVGNFMGDFVRKSEDSQYDQAIQRGLALHRAIDNFTDSHPLVRASTRLLHARHHKYAPVLLDVFYDFFLTNNWSVFSEQALDNFAKDAYAVLDKHLRMMPPILQHRLPLMIADDWLVRYGTLDGLQFTFSRMQRRVSQPAHFETAIESLQTHFEPLEGGFKQFFPDAIQFVQQFRK